MYLTRFIHPQDNDVRNRLAEQGLMDVLVRQLQFKDSALLAAYALMECLSYHDGLLTCY